MCNSRDVSNSTVGLRFALSGRDRKRCKWFLQCANGAIAAFLLCRSCFESNISQTHMAGSLMEARCKIVDIPADLSDYRGPWGRRRSAFLLRPSHILAARASSMLREVVLLLLSVVLSRLVAQFLCQTVARWRARAAVVFWRSFLYRLPIAGVPGSLGMADELLGELEILSGAFLGGVVAGQMSHSEVGRGFCGGTR